MREQSFLRKTSVPGGGNSHFRQKQVFRDAGTVIFEKNKRSGIREQSFLRKTSVPGVGNKHF